MIKQKSSGYGFHSGADGWRQFSVPKSLIFNNVEDLKKGAPVNDIVKICEAKVRLRVATAVRYVSDGDDLLIYGKCDGLK